MTILPRRLVKGDTIGIVSPASPFPAWFPRRFARSVSNLESKGYKVKLGTHARDKLGHKAGRKEDRLEDLHAMYRDESVRLIMTTLGGFSSNELLDDLACELVRRNPTGLIGYSDITALHLAIHSSTGLACFCGPDLLSQFGEFRDVLPYTSGKTMDPPRLGWTGTWRTCGPREFSKGSRACWSDARGRQASSQRLQGTASTILFWTIRRATIFRS